MRITLNYVPDYWFQPVLDTTRLNIFVSSATYLLVSYAARLNYYYSDGKVLFFIFIVVYPVDDALVHSFYSSKEVGFFVDDLIAAFWFSGVASAIGLIV